MRRSIPLLLAGVFLLAACGNDAEDVTAGAPDPTDTPPAAGACLEGATDCADIPGGPAEPGAPPDEPVSHTPDDSDQPGEPSEPQPKIVQPTGNATNVHRIDWDELRATDDGDDRTHLVTFWGGVEPCFVVDHVDVEETPNQVTVTVFAGSAPEAEGQACIELAEYKAVEITLAEPLGDRGVVDGGEQDQG